MWQKFDRWKIESQNRERKQREAEENKKRDQQRIGT